ncbi:MAG TPA: hypothetical protein VKS78_14430 [Roseiarcus sp.]|nr:hypothetical protein [Roseiarcus sp.]
MQTIPWLAEVDSLSGFELTALVMIVLISAWGAGFMVDAAMGRFGLGPFINGILVLFGACFGIYARYAFIVAPADLDVGLTLGFAAGTPMALLMAIGILRAWLF